MSEKYCRISCTVHHKNSGRLIETVKELDPPSVLYESCRTVRQLEKPRRFGLPGVRTYLNDSLGDLFHITVTKTAAREIIKVLADVSGIEVSGHGSMIIQELNACSLDNSGEILPAKKDFSLAQITCIQSEEGAGEKLAGIALELGTVVPTVTLGIGTGIRDRLGLLRVTIPPKKELVQVTVPYHDAEGIIQMLIEQGKLDRPGGGFIYQAPVLEGFLDTRIRIGKQSHAASIEQIIAALDDLRGSTAWRKRFIEPGKHSQRFMKNCFELTFSCTEGNSGEAVNAAMKAGAGGATISKMQRICRGETAAWERITCIISSRISKKVFCALQKFQEREPSACGCVEMIQVPLAYSYGS